MLEWGLILNKSIFLMSEIPIFTLAIATYISTNDHLERAGYNTNQVSDENHLSS